MSGKSRMVKRRNRIYRRIAVALTVALLVGQSHAFVLAEEDAGDVQTTEISDEKKTDVETGEDISGVDADGDTENAGEGSEDIIGDETEPGTGIENGEEEIPEEILEENVSENGDEIEEVEELEEVLTTAADGIETYANGDTINVTDSIVMYRIKNESTREVRASISWANKEKLVELKIPGIVEDDSGTEWTVTEVGAFNECENLQSVVIPEGVTTIAANAFYRCEKLEDLIIPTTVTSIGDYAFGCCRKLEKVVIPDGVTAISLATFEYCDSLTSVKLPSNISSIGDLAFLDCKLLEDIELPDSVTSIGVRAFMFCSSVDHVNLKNVTQIGDYAFTGCKILNNVSIPDKLTSMGITAFSSCVGWTNDGNNSKNIVIPRSLDKISARTFDGCSGLSEFTIPDSVAIIDENAFKNCSKFQTLNIAVSDTSISIPVKDATVFEGCPSPRQVVFWNADGTEKLSGSSLNAAKKTYLGASDGNTDDEEWWGWYVGRPSEETDTYTVTVKVQKDGNPWTDHGRRFDLRPEQGGDFLELSGQPIDSTYQITQVPSGTYKIFDITDAPEGSRYSKAVDTGMEVRVGDGDTEVKVTVEDKDVEVEKPINYYTATFYDGDIAYGADNPPKPQIILKGKQVVRPAAPPEKDGYTFLDWMTENDGSTRFDFENTPIENPTSIYASWTKEGADDPDPVVKNYTINATAGEGGRIDPTGLQSVPEGGSKEFTIIPSEGYRIKSVMVNGEDKTEEIKEAGNSYTFTITNVKENHTIRVTFEKVNDNSGSGDDDNSGGGDHGNSDSGNGDHGSSGGGNGDSGNGDAGNSGSGDNAGGSSDGGDNAGGGNSAVSNLSAGSAEAGGNFAAGSNSDGTASGGSAGSKEPKTGDASQAEVYATIAMIAGLTYLLLYVMEEGRGMSEQEKDELVAAFVRWAKKGSAFRRCCAMAAIFCILAYYHSIGKRIGRNALDEKYLGQLS